MSRKIALDAICLKPGERPGHTEYSMNYHEAYLKKLNKPFNEAWEIDFCWHTNDGPLDWFKNGRATDMGHAEYAADGSDRAEAKACSFNDPEEILVFDPSREYGLPDFGELVKYYEDIYQKGQNDLKDQIFTGGYYKSVVSGMIQAFGWEMLLLAAADRERFAELVRRFGQYTLHYNKAWAKTSIEVFIQHDDMVWSSGPFLPPKFYREAIFPVYKELWAPLKKAGKKVLFCSDGTWDMFMPDIADCGADGFIFEPSNDFKHVAKRFGKTHCLVGSAVDCRTMTFGSWDQVRAQIDATLSLARECRGLIFAVGNHIPANVSDEMCDLYINYLRKNWFYDQKTP